MSQYPNYYSHLSSQSNGQRFSEHFDSERNTVNIVGHEHQFPISSTENAENSSFSGTLAIDPQYCNYPGSLSSYPAVTTCLTKKNDGKLCEETVQGTSFYEDKRLNQNIAKKYPFSNAISMMPSENNATTDQFLVPSVASRLRDEKSGRHIQPADPGVSFYENVIRNQTDDTTYPFPYASAAATTADSFPYPSEALQRKEDKNGKAALEVSFYEDRSCNRMMDSHPSFSYADDSSHQTVDSNYTFPCVDVMATSTDPFSYPSEAPQRKEENNGKSTLEVSFYEDRSFSQVVDNHNPFTYAGDISHQTVDSNYTFSSSGVMATTTDPFSYQSVASQRKEEKNGKDFQLVAPKVSFYEETRCDQNAVHSPLSSGAEVVSTSLSSYSSVVTQYKENNVQNTQLITQESSLSEGGSHQQNKKWCRCPDCPRIYSSGHKLQRHVRAHSDHPFECDVCGSAFSEKRYLFQHQNFFSSEKPLVCKRCGNIYFLKCAREMHYCI